MFSGNSAAWEAAFTTKDTKDRRKSEGKPFMELVRASNEATNIRHLLSFAFPSVLRVLRGENHLFNFPDLGRSHVRTDERPLVDRRANDRGEYPEPHGN